MSASPRCSTGSRHRGAPSSPPVPGTTRDVISQPVEWHGVDFELTDTGGMFGASEDPLHALVLEQGQRAIETADLLVFVVDGRRGTDAGRRRDRPGAARERESRSSWRSTRWTTAARATARSSSTSWASSRWSRSRRSTARGSATCSTRSCVAPACGVGRPDNGPATERPSPRTDGGGATSSGPDRGRSASRSSGGRTSASRRWSTGCCARSASLVSDMPGTTRDAVDSLLRWHRREFRIVDTAGIRRPGKVARSGQVESVSVIVARRAVEARGRRGGRDRRRRRGDRAGRRHRRRSRAGRLRHHRRGQQVGPDEGRTGPTSRRRSTTRCSGG